MRIKAGGTTGAEERFSLQEISDRRRAGDQLSVAACRREYIPTVNNQPVPILNFIDRHEAVSWI